MANATRTHIWQILTNQAHNFHNITSSNIIIKEETFHVVQLLPDKFQFNYNSISELQSMEMSFTKFQNKDFVCTLYLECNHYCLSTSVIAQFLK